MNVVLVVIDSLRAGALVNRTGHGPRTPFLDQLGRETIHFRRAYATECWTLPTHASLFTGQQPAEHAAHFQSMAYQRSSPTVAESLSRRGYTTEVVTRNSIFDGSIPGITRGFQRNTCLPSTRPRLDPLVLFLSLTKPRFRRQIFRSGFFSPRQRQSRAFVGIFARAMLPADERTLSYALDRMVEGRRTQRPYFLFLNLYDVHAPYAPAPNSILRPFRSLSGLIENTTLPFVLPGLGAHRYLEPGFQLSPSSRLMLLDRYHRAIELADAKLAAFYAAARSAGLLDDTLLIVTSDHGEGFGEHGLYLHDASLYDTHLHVPLWVHHPQRAPEVIDDVVSTKDLCALMLAGGGAARAADTILDAGYRATHPIASAEHFHYPHAPRSAVRYRQDLAAAVCGTAKVIIRREGIEHYDLARDPDEQHPEVGPLADFAAACRREGASASATAAVIERLRAWANRQGHEPPTASAAAPEWPRLIAGGRQG